MVFVQLASCEGDPAPFEEGVQLSELQVETLSVRAVGVVAENELSVNPGRQLQFRIFATNRAGEPVELSSNDRRWSSSQPAFGSITDSGAFTALADGDTQVSVNIGGIQSAAFTVDVSSASLTGISEIRGNTQVSTCSRHEYTAVGSFDDNTFREINNVVWNILAPANTGQNGFDASIYLNSPERAEINARGPQTFDVVATQDGFSQTLQVEVVDDLNLLRIEGVPSELAHNQTVSLRAFADGIEDPAVAQVARDVTNIVYWTVSAPLNIASITNSTINEPRGGRITGTLGGTGMVQAFCGNQSASVPLTVADINYNNFNITPSGDQTLRLGSSITFVARATPDGESEPENVTDGRTLWIPSDTDILEVDVRENEEEVVVSGRRLGVADLVVRFGDDEITIRITVQ